MLDDTIFPSNGINLPSFMAGYAKKGKKKRSYCRECTFQKYKHEFEESFESTVDVMRKIENLNESE
jgi:hypothetical protein